MAMVLRINPSRIPLWRSGNEIQFGSGANAVRLTGLERNHEKLLQMLTKGIPNSYFRQVAADLGVDTVDEFLTSIQPALIQSTEFAIDQDFVANQFAEICRAQASYNHTGAAIMANRKASRVFAGGDASSELAVTSLANSGVGLVTANPDKVVDFAILFSQHTIAPGQYSTWLSNMTPHIAVIFDQVGVLVTPVIEAGKTPCLTCYHEQLTAQDSAWPSLASQLLFSEQKFDDSVSKHFGVGIAVNRALNAIDSLAKFGISETNRLGYRLDVASGTVSTLAWGFAERCLCQQG